jgi:hypothetical protein
MGVLICKDEESIGFRVVVKRTAGIEGCQHRLQGWHGPG